MEKRQETLRRLKLLPQLFRKQDVDKITPHGGVFLSRAAQKGFVHRINRGNYVNSFLCGFPCVEEVACFLRPPAYISCEWALNHHGVILQSPTACTVVTLSTAVGKKRNIQYQGVTIEFSKISPMLFFGFSYENGFQIASPEKAILDSIYYRGFIPVHDELELETVDFDVLSKMAEAYPKSTAKHIIDL